MTCCAAALGVEAWGRLASGASDQRRKVDPTHLDTKDTIMEAIGIEVTHISEEKVVATMLVHGPTLP